MSGPGGRPGFLPEVQLLRGAAIIGVVAIHTLSYVNGLTGFDPFVGTVTALLSFAHYAVPLFVFIAAVVYARRGNEVPGWGSFMAARLRRIVPAYLAWSIVYLLFGGFYFGQWPTFRTGVTALLTGGASRHLWFIPFILGGYCLLPPLNRLHRVLAARGLSWVFLAAGVAIQVPWNLMVLAFDWRILAWMPPVLFRPLVSESALSGFAFLVLGIHAGANWDRLVATVRESATLRIALPPATAGVFLAAAAPPLVGMARAGGGAGVRAAYFVIPIVLDPLLRMLTFLLLLRVVLQTGERSWIRGRLAALGADSFGIYLSHVLFLLPLGDWLQAMGFGPSGGGFYVLATAGTLMLSSLAAGIWRRAGLLIGGTAP